MNHIFVAFSLLFLSAEALSQGNTDPRYSLRTNQALSGSVDRTTIAEHARYPLNKRYEDFTPEQKQVLRSFYEDMPETDDPPFPAAGMRRILAEVSRITGDLRVEGALRIHVSVDEKGEATSVKVLERPNKDVARAVAYTLLKTRYKPANCAGQPCSMEFPFYFMLSLR